MSEFKKNNVPGKVIAILFFLILIGIIGYKVVYLPITFDEETSSIYYPTFSVWQIMMYPDNWPSNHILNTLCIKLSESLFGIEPWSVRLPAILSFVFFYAVVFMIASRYFSKQWQLFIIPFFVIFCNPFLLDFYGLARGYGLSNALMAGSIYCLLMFSGSFKQRWYFLAIVWAMLAAYANFTLLIYWVALQMLLVVMQLIYSVKTRSSLGKMILQFGETAILAVGFLALCYQPLYKMQSTNQFVYWTKNGFYNDTLFNQVEQFIYSNREYFFCAQDVAHGVVVVFIVTAIYSAYKIFDNIRTAISNPLVITFLLLFFVWLVNIIQCAVLGTPYLSTRTALSYYVLFAFMFAFLLLIVGQHVRLVRKVIVPVLILLLVIHLQKNVSLKYVREWFYNEHTYEVRDYLYVYKQQHPEVGAISLNTTWLFFPGFNFYKSTGKIPWMDLTNYHQNVDTNSTTLFYYATNEDAAILKNYKSVKEFSGNVLLMRKE